MSTRTGGVVQSHKKRKAILITIDNSEITISITKKTLALGRETAQQAKTTFTTQLIELSGIVQKQQQNAKSEIELKQVTDDAKREKILQQSLTLDENTCLEQLDALRKIGTSVRSVLSNEIVEAFQKKGFLADKNQQEPSLSFIEDIYQDDAKAPILWDMMHEIGQKKFNDVTDESNWSRFWGFRVPITHWIFDQEPPEEIRLRKTFSAIHEDLRFAVKEEQLLQKNFSEKRHQSLTEAFRFKVNEELKRELIEEIKVDNWWLTCKHNYWLKNYIQELTDKQSGRIAKNWTENTLVSILKDCQKHYDLLHFACHCEASEKSEFLSVLNMKVGGLPIALDVATMAVELRHCEDEEESDNQDEDETNWDTENSGRLVFLNACDSGGQSSAATPPGFPYKWIECHNASAVIVTLCKIPDYFAYAFAEKFYENLFKNISNPDNISYVAEALLETRRYFMKEHNNPLGLAYVLYAIKEAYVTADFI